MRVRKLLLFIALCAALGCKRSNESMDGGIAPDAGYQPVQPMQPMQPMPDSGMQIESDAGDGAVVEPMLPPNFTLECSDDVGDAPDGDPLAAWAAEREAHGALGRAATLSLQGSAYRIEGTGVADLEAPFTLVVGGGRVGGIVVFAGASVDDVEERGELAIYTGDLSASTPKETLASAGAIEALGLKTVVLAEGTLEGTVDVVTERIGNTDFYRASASVTELELNDLYQASLLPEGTYEPDSRIEWMPTGPVVIHEASGLTFYDETGGSVRMPPSTPLEASYAAFGVGGDFAAGTLEIDGERVQGTPSAVFGLQAELRAEAGLVEAVDGFRLTQAINEVGLVVPAQVEIVAEAREVWVPVNEERIVRFHYRERSYTGDAVLAEIQAGGAANDLIELQTGFLEDTLTAQLIGAVGETGWAAPIVAIAAIPTISVVFVIDVFECIFGGCLDLPAPLEPFPQWIDAGGMGTMEVRVKGDLVSGTYETSLTFIGRNYCAVTVPLTVHVGIEPPPVDAGSDSGADAGDGAVGDGG
jgi:hypothetical protein